MIFVKDRLCKHLVSFRRFFSFLQINNFRVIWLTNHCCRYRRSFNMADPSTDCTGLFSPPATLQDEAHVKNMEQYNAMYKQSIEDPEGFWSKIAENFHWNSPPTGKFLEYNFDVRNGPIFIKWMQGATTNVCYNAVDRHIKNGLGNKIAFYW